MSTVTYSIDEHYRTSATAEELLHEWTHDFSEHAAGALPIAFSALVSAAGGAQGTFRLRLGGTVGAADGTIAATLVTTNPSFEAKGTAVSVSNPGGQTLVKITGSVSSAAQYADIRGMVATIGQDQGAAIVPPAPAPSASPGGINPANELDRAWGRDIWFDLSAQDGPDRVVTPDGDWLLVGGPEALRQSLIRRFLTNPGEWKTLPEYGAGARLFVKARNTRAARDELTERLRAQALRDWRVRSVEAVSVEIGEDVVKIAVTVRAIGTPDKGRPITAAVEIR